MARFKDKDLRLSTNEEALFGSSQEASIKWDGSDLIINQVPKHTTQGYLATQQFVENAVANLEWQDAVLSRTTSAAPASPDYKDRYIVPSGGSGSWSGHDDEIAEYTTTWEYTVPSAGFACWVVDEGIYVVYSGSAWIRFGAVIDHGSLLGLSDDDHTQYLNTTRHDTTDRHGSSVVDHGQIGGLGDDDHSQYLNITRHDTTDRHGSSVVDHGSIGGLNDDDHTQYLLVDGSRNLSGNLTQDNGLYISTDEIRARDASGLSLTTSAANPSLTVLDSGMVALQNSAAQLRFNDDGTDSGGYLFSNTAGQAGIMAGVKNTGAAWEARDTESTIIWLDDGNLFIYGNTGLTVGNTYSPTLRFMIDTGGSAYIGTSYTNVNMTRGLTINQATNDDEILAFKSTGDVAHGVTNVAETDTYGKFEKLVSSTGGLEITGLAEDAYGIWLTGIATTGGNAKATTAKGPVMFMAQKKSGASATYMDPGDNIVVMRDHIEARWILDQTGRVDQSGDFMPFDNATQDIGALNNMWGNIYCDSLTVSSGGTTGIDHGDLLGLADDDHTQYLPTDGTRAMTGSLTVGSSGSSIVFTEDIATFGLASHPNILTLVPSGALFTTDISATAFYGDVVGMSVLHSALTNLDADDHTQYVLADGSRTMTGDLGISASSPAVTLTDDGGFVGQFTIDDDTINVYADPTNAVANSGFNLYIDGTAAGNLVMSVNAQTMALWGNLTIPNHYLEVKGDEGSEGLIYLYADQGDENDDKWRFIAKTDANFAIQSFATGGWVDTLSTDVSGNITVAGNATITGNLLPTTSDTYDLGHSDAVWDNIWCKTLHTSAGSIELGSISLTDVGGILTTTANVDADSFIYTLPDTDHTATGDTTSLHVTANSTGFGAILYMTSGGQGLEEADASHYWTMPVRALALETGTGTKNILLKGFIRDDSWNWSPGLNLYASETAGTMTQDTPSASGVQVQALGWAYSADIIYFDPDKTVVEIT